MTKYVLFVMTGPAHLPYLAVALRTLRNHWDGEVVVHAWDESFDIATKLCSDSRIKARCVRRFPGYRGKNQQEVDKIKIVQQEFSKNDLVMYVDADTIFANDPSPFFDEIAKFGFVATQFGDWTMKVNTARKRVQNLLAFPEIPHQYVENSMQPDRIALNSGVFGTYPSHAALPDWGDWTFASRSIFISGETALHPVVDKYDLYVRPTGDFNCSPKHKSPHLADKDVSVWHGHGDSFLRPEKCRKGLELWKPEFGLAMSLNIGGIQDWIRDIPNKYLDSAGLR